MKSFLFLFLFSISSLFAIEPISDILSDKEIVMIEKGVLVEALKSNDYDAISTMALSFQATSQSPSYKGNALKLANRAKFLYEYCHKGNHIVSSLYLVSLNRKSNPFYCRKIAYESISNNRSNSKMKYNPLYINLVMLYVSSVLDHEQTDKDEVNFALEALQGLPEENTQTKFYSAFLFRALGMEDVANAYLNDACHLAKPGSSIIKYCTSGDTVEMEDILRVKVANPDCNKDIGERCK